MNWKLTVSLSAGFAAAVVAIFGDQVATGVVHLPPVAVPYVKAGVGFLLTVLTPSVLGAILNRDLPEPPRG